LYPADMALLHPTIGLYKVYYIVEDR